MRVGTDAQPTYDLFVHPATAAVPVVSRPAVSTGEERVVFREFYLGDGNAERAFERTVDAASVEGVAVGLDATLLALDERLNVVSALPVRFRRRVTVGDTATLVGTDASEAVRVVATVEKHPPRFLFKLRYLAGGQALPQQLLPSFRFLRALRRPNRLGIRIGERMVGGPEELSSALEFPAQLVEVARSLAFIQRMTGVRFPVPAELGSEDLHAIREAEALLRGERQVARWTAASLGFSSIDAALLEVVADGAPFRLEFAAPVSVSIAGHEVELGEAHYVFMVAVIENYEELLRAQESENAADVKARLRPGSVDLYEVTLVAPPTLGLDDHDVRPPLGVAQDVLTSARSRPLRPGAFQPEPS